MKRPNRWLAGLLAAAMMLGWGSGAVLAADRTWNAGQTISTEPKMNIIPNTDVYYQRRAPGYDLYRYADRWYLVDEGSWYAAGSWRGPFAEIQLADLPEEIGAIPAEYRKHWSDDVPDAWPSQRSITKKPKMSPITGSRVTFARQFPDFDLYRYRSGWYLMENGVWYRSDSWKGPFLSTVADSVPSAVRSVPSSYRRHWEVPASP